MKKLITKKDILLIITLTALGMIMGFSTFQRAQGETAVVRFNGEVAEEISLNGDYYETEINSVTICRENGKVFIKNSSCPDKLCMRGKGLSKSGDTAVCVPNKVTVEIRGGKSKVPDAITG